MAPIVEGRRVMAAALASTLLSIPYGAVAQTTHEVVISNESDYDVHELFVSPSEVAEWGSNQLDDDILTTGTGHTFDMEAGQ